MEGGGEGELQFIDCRQPPVEAGGVGRADVGHPAGAASGPPPSSSSGSFPGAAVQVAVGPD